MHAIEFTLLVCCCSISYLYVCPPYLLSIFYREKWSFFDESNRVPLLFHHPQSPFKGQHYPEPVELVDVYPTIVDLLNVDYVHADVCHGTVEVGRDFLPLICHNLQGKSLARVVMGDRYYREHIENNPRHLNNLDRYSKQSEERRTILGADYKKFPSAGSNSYQKALSFQNDTEISNILKSSRRHLRSQDAISFANATSVTSTDSRRLLDSETMPLLDQRFAISQSWRCAKQVDVKKNAFWHKSGAKGDRPSTRWVDCDKTVDPDNNDQVSVMGYSLRSSDFRYNAWFHYDRKRCLPILDKPLFDEEVCVDICFHSLMMYYFSISCNDDAAIVIDSCTTIVARRSRTSRT